MMPDTVNTAEIEMSISAAMIRMPAPSASSPSSAAIVRMPPRFGTVRK
jgi:hypothetical protein